MSFRVGLIVMAGVLGAERSLAQTEATPERAANRTIVDAAHAAALMAHGSNELWFVRRGLTADREHHQVTVLAEATGLGKNETVEFFLIDEASGHDYESLAVSFAKPSDIHAALVHIGMTPGAPVDFSAFRFWPKGERVILSFRPHQADAGTPEIRAEQLIQDTSSGAPMRERGFVFTGSRIRPVNAEDGEPAGYAADLTDPYSIASNYNEPQTVLDVPRQAPQGSVYGQQVVHPDHVFPAGQLLEVTLRPEFNDGRRRVLPLEVDVHPRREAGVNGVEGLSFTVTSPSKEHPLPLTDGTLVDLLKLFTELCDGTRDPYVVWRMNEALSVSAIRDLCRIVTSIDTETGIRVEPPAPGQLYYKAFIPDETYRERARRPTQPRELHLWSSPAGTATGLVTEIEELWKADAVFPDLRIADHAIATPEEFQRRLQEHASDVPVILAFVRPEVTHGQLMAYLEPVRKDYPIIHVFVEP